MSEPSRAEPKKRARCRFYPVCICGCSGLELCKLLRGPKTAQTNGRARKGHRGFVGPNPG